MPMEEVRDIYRRSVKLPGYLTLNNPAPGYTDAVQAQGKLKGLTLVPLSEEGTWRGLDEKGRLYEISYSKELGLLAGRVP